MNTPGVLLVLPDGQPYEYTQSTVRMPNGPRVREIVINDEPSNTQDSFGNDTDINTIMARFERTGILPPNTAEPQYADVVDLQGDLTEIHQRSMEAISIADKFAQAWKPKEPDPELTPTAEFPDTSPPA